MSNVIVWEIETVPDLQAVAAANGHAGRSDHEIRVAMGESSPSTPTTQSFASVP
jgi:hypothetical protein